MSDFHNLPRKRIGAGIVIVDPSDRILLVQPVYKTTWEIPGGIVEAGESPRSAAIREAEEELGIKIIINRLLLVDWVEPGLLPDDGIMFVYSAEAFDTAQIHLPPEELKSWEWCDLATVESRVPGFMFRRLELAVLALKNGDFFELENGIRT